MIRTLRRLLDTSQLIAAQNDLIQKQRGMIEAQERLLASVHLDYNRELQSLVVGWILSHEQPEIDVRPDLFQLNVELADQISRLEEVVV